MGEPDNDQRSNQPTNKKDPEAGEKRAKDLEPPKEKDKDVKGGPRRDYSDARLKERIRAL